MGSGLVSFYQNKIKKSWKFAFLSTFIIGMTVHIYKFTNTLPNHDSLYNYYSDQNVIYSGRWFLEEACRLSSYYDLPWVIGLLSIIYIALTVVVLVELFKIENPVLIALTGALLVTFPAVTVTFFYEFTADGYMLAMLFAALAVYFNRFEDTSKQHCILSIILICLSCGIYQAYVSFALVLTLCYFITELIENKYDTKKYFTWALKQFAVYAAALASYFVTWKVLMRVEGAAATSYQGIDNLGFDIGALQKDVIKAFKNFRIFFTERQSITKSGISLFAVLGIAFLVVLAITVITVIIKKKVYKNVFNLLFFIIAAAAVPVSVYIWYFTSSQVYYHILMLQSICVVYIFIAVIAERYFKIHWKNAVAALLLLIVMNNGLSANIGYFYMNKTCQASYATGTEMISRIHQLDTDSDKMYVIGEMKKDNQLRSDRQADSIYTLSKMFYRNLLFNQTHVVSFINNNFNEDFKEASPEEIEKLSQMPEVSEMHNWPASDSLKVVDGVVVIKLS